MADKSSETTIPVAEETARVETREVVAGRVRVHTKVDLIEETVEASLRDESIDITRVPIGREINAAPEIRTEGDLTIIPILEEVLVVEKRLVLKEELHIRRRVETEKVETPVQLRKQRAVVERDEY